MPPPTMFAGRKHRLTVIVALLLITAFVYWQRISSGGFNLFTGKLLRGSGFNWRDVPVRYPQEQVIALPTQQPKSLPRVQATFGKESPDEAKKRKSRQESVKAAFERSWQSYKARAWGADELAPLSGGPKHNYGGWGASLVDNLDTLWMMDMKGEFRTALDAALQIRFDKSTLEEVNVFETTIRYLGGFLAAYDLSGDHRLLQKAVELGDMLLVAFDTPTHLPITRWRMAQARQGYAQTAGENVLLAEIASLSLEFTRLSQITQDNRYYSAIATINTLLATQQSETQLPGLWPVVVSAKRSNFTEHNTFTLGGMADSAYEYIPKMHALLGGSDPSFEKMYSSFSKTALAHNIRRPMLPDNADILIAVDAIVRNKGVFLHEQGQHLVCFAGGMFALAGKLFSLPEHVAVGGKITDGCVWTYDHMPTGIMPELFTMATCGRTDECKWNLTRYEAEVISRANHPESADLDAKKIMVSDRLPEGFTSIPDRRYVLRPEAIESVFVMYRVSGDRRWLDVAWRMFQRILELSWTQLANGMIEDVSVQKDKVVVGDVMESFWMAETLKYFYLIFSEPSLISLDEYVFNTEAHPFRRPNAPDSN